MRALSKSELEALLSRITTLTDTEITALLDELEKDQPHIYALIYGDPCDAIAERHLDMSHTYIGLCFEIVFVYREAFGVPPRIERGEEWFDEALTRFIVDMNNFYSALSSDNRVRAKLQERFSGGFGENGFQSALLDYLENEVEEAMSLEEERQSAREPIWNCLFLFLMMMDELYGRKEK